MEYRTHSRSAWVPFSLILMSLVGCSAQIFVPSNVPSESNADFCAAQADGELDIDYAVDGRFTLDLDNVDNVNSFSSTSSHLYADGSFLIGANAGGAYNRPAIVKVNAEGSFDTAYGTGGISRIDAGVTAAVAGIAPDGQGNIFVGINRNFARSVAKVDSSGILVPFFGTGGVYNSGLSGTSDNTMVRPSDGAVMVSGQRQNGTWDLSVTAFNPLTGSPLAGFGTSGTAHSGIAADEFGATLTFDVDGDRFFLGGNQIVGGSWLDFSVVKFGANGIKDATYGSSGQARYALSTGAEAIYSALSVSSGKIVAVGQMLTNDALILQLNSNGTLDTGFGSSGYTVTDYAGAEDFWRHVLRLPNGQFLTTGHVTESGKTKIALGLFSATGQPDTSFGDNGILVLDLGAGNQVGVSSHYSAVRKRLWVFGSIYNGANTDILLTRICLNR